MHQHEHAASGVAIQPGTAEWSEWVKDYYRDVETYDWVDVADNLRGLEAFFHRNRARVVRRLIARNGMPGAPILDAGCGTGLNLRHLPPGGGGWTEGRDFPAPKGKTFRELYADRKKP